MNTGRYNAVRGFTLVEMAIVTMIAGLFFVAAAKVYSNEMRKRNIEKTIENMEITQEAIDEFFFREGRYPCPANPTIAPGDVGYGREQCRDNITEPEAAGLAYENVGSRDAGGGPLGRQDPDGNNDPVVIGTVPFVTLSEFAVSTSYDVADGHDAYGNRLSYAVSEYMSLPPYDYDDPVKPRLGVIGVYDANGRSVTTPANTAHYVVYSHGETAEGAYTREGNRVTGCLVPGFAVVPPSGFNPGQAGISVELENCDNNDTFFVKELRSYANSDDFNDDILYYGMNLQSSIWRPSVNAPPSEMWYYNTNIGSIASGSMAPSSLLYISGDIRAETQMESDIGFCPMAYVSAGQCLQPDFLGGTGFDCPPGQIAEGIEQNRLVCKPLLTKTPDFGIYYCSGGKYMTGFSIDANEDAKALCATP